MLNANTYVTNEKGIGGTIRNQYEDFYVEEIPEMTPTGEGPNIWIWIEKVGRTTLDVVLDIARDLHISRKRMGFAGMKDKKARTRQWICISNMESEEQFRQVKDLEGTIYKTDFLKVVRGRKKLRMGQLKGNKFQILIRDIDDIEKSEEHEENQKARQAYDDGNLEESLELMSKGMRYEKMMVRELIKDAKKGPLDDKAYKNALHALPKPLQRMFVHAYQSYLFNDAVSRRVAMGINRYVEGDIIIDNEERIIRDKTPEEFQNLIDNFEANPTSPLYGTKVPFAGGEVGEMEKSVLNSYNLTKEDFEVPKMPRLGSHGLRRSMRIQVWDASAIPTDEGVLTEFSINKGSYATAVLREVMKKDVV